MSDFPTIVYRVPGRHWGPNGATYDYRGVADQAEFSAALADGWHETIMGAVGADRVIEAAEALEDAINDVSPATRDELEQRAKALGVSFNKRTADAVLVQRIAEAS